MWRCESLAADQVMWLVMPKEKWEMQVPPQIQDKKLEDLPPQMQSLWKKWWSWAC
jgi:hypothetical protein